MVGTSAKSISALAVLGVVFDLMLCLEVWRKMGVERRGVVERTVKKNGYPLPYLDVFKIKGKDKFGNSFIQTFLYLLSL